MSRVKICPHFSRNLGDWPPFRRISERFRWYAF